MFKAIENKIRIYSKEINKPLKDLTILVSFSGGVDSTVLSSILYEISIQYGVTLYLIHFNHNAHFKADDMESFCKYFAQQYDTQYFIKNLPFINKTNFESNSRSKRYTELDRKVIQLNCDFALTAHHKDDQIETLYMKNNDGSDWISKIGIRERMGSVRRPLLDISKTMIIDYAKKKNISWIEDPSNDDISLRRNYVRNILLPKIVSKNADVARKLLDEAKLNYEKLNSVFCHFDKKKQSLIHDATKLYLIINLKEIVKFSVEELKLFLYWALKDTLNENIPNKSRRYWNEFSKYLCNSSTGAKFIIGEMICFLNRSKYTLIIVSSRIIDSPEIKALYCNVKWYNSFFKVRDVQHFHTSKNKNKLIVPSEIWSNGLYLRRWKIGEKLFANSNHKHILVSDLFINNKLSDVDKLIQPIIVDKADKIVWIPGIAHADIKIDTCSDLLKEVEWLQS